MTYKAEHTQRHSLKLHRRLLCLLKDLS